MAKVALTEGTWTKIAISPINDVICPTKEWNKRHSWRNVHFRPFCSKSKTVECRVGQLSPAAATGISLTGILPNASKLVVVVQPALADELTSRYAPNFF